MLWEGKKYIYYVSINGTYESPEIDPHLHSQLIFHKGTKVARWRKDLLYNK